MFSIFGKTFFSSKVTESSTDVKLLDIVQSCIRNMQLLIDTQSLDSSQSKELSIPVISEIIGGLVTSSSCVDELSDALSNIRIVILSDDSVNINDRVSNDCKEVLVSSMLQEGLVELLVLNIGLLPLEAKKNVVFIFQACIKWNYGQFNEHFCSNERILDKLIDNYLIHDVALHCGTLLRESIRNYNKTVTTILTTSKRSLWKLFEICVNDNVQFDIIVDAFNTIREILTCADKVLVSNFLSETCDEFNVYFDTFILSKNYVIRRLSLKLLGELLLDKSNVDFTVSYVANKANLINVMKLLIDPSTAIQFESFHVLKVFIIIPNKTKQILRILYQNKTKLIQLIERIGIQKTDSDFLHDGHDSEDKRFVLSILESLQIVDDLEEIIGTNI